MPAKALRALDGTDIPMADIRLNRSEELFGLPPAEIAAIINNQSERSDVDPGMVTASQAENGARQLYLQEFFDYSLVPARQMKAMLGTMRHAVVNINHNDLIVETRYKSPCGRFSAKVDTYVPETGTIRDAKFVGTYKVLQILKRGLEQEGRGYLYQLNLAAWILRDLGFTINKLLIDFRPSDCGTLEKKDLFNNHGITYTGETPIVVEAPHLDRDTTFAPYEALWQAKQRAIETGKVPDYCTKSQTWGGKKCTMGYCPVAELCLRLATEAGEEHPYLTNSKASQSAA